jgi:hypothetical protein
MPVKHSKSVGGRRMCKEVDLTEEPSSAQKPKHPTQPPRPSLTSRVVSFPPPVPPIRAPDGAWIPPPNTATYTHSNPFHADDEIIEVESEELSNSDQTRPRRLTAATSSQAKAVPREYTRRSTDAGPHVPIMQPIPRDSRVPSVVTPSRPIIVPSISLAKSDILRSNLLIPQSETSETSTMSESSPTTQSSASTQSSSSTPLSSSTSSVDEDMRTVPKTNSK